MAGKFLTALFISLFLLVTSSTSSYAVIKTLNGQNDQDQIFTNDTNLGIISSAGIHALQWLGILPISRGGTGGSSFTNGSIPFISSGVFTEDNSNLFWDTTNFRLGIGTSTPAVTLHVNGSILSAPADGGPDDGIRLDANGDVDLQSINFLRPFGTGQISESADGNVIVSPGLSIAEGCLIMRDSDGSGVTYVTANDGVLTASATKPSICQ